MITAREIVIPSLVESIDKSAFEGCPLTSVELPSKLKTIGESAFRSCPLEEIVIPQSVTLIDNFAFDDCYSLKRLKIENAPVTIIAAFPVGILLIFVVWAFMKDFNARSK